MVRVRRSAVDSTSITRAISSLGWNMVDARIRGSVLELNAVRRSAGIVWDVGRMVEIRSLTAPITFGKSM
jgi:hypothetical protein